MHCCYSNVVFAGTRDGAAADGAAIKQLLFFYPNIMDVICFSHTINNVGYHFVFSVLDTCFRHWVKKICLPTAIMLNFSGKRELEGRCVLPVIHDGGASESSKQISDYFGAVASFLQENENLSPQIRQHLMEIINDPQELQDLRLELGVNLMVDVGVHFVNATYYLEEDGPLIFTCFERL